MPIGPTTRLCILIVLQPLGRYCKDRFLFLFPIKDGLNVVVSPLVGRALTLGCSSVPCCRTCKSFTAVPPGSSNMYRYLKVLVLLLCSSLLYVSHKPFPRPLAPLFLYTCICAPFVSEIDHSSTPVLQQWRPFTHRYSLVYRRQSSPSFLSLSVCRFKHLNKKSPTPKDYDAIDKDARVSETFVRSVIQVVPSEEWTPELTR